MAKISLVIIFVVFTLTSPVVLTFKIEKSVHAGNVFYKFYRLILWFILNSWLFFPKEHPHECWDQEVDAFYQHGSYNQRPGKCEMIRCFADSSMEAVGCHTKALQPGCSASPTDFKKSYPDCCPRINCTPPPINYNDHHYNNHHNYHSSNHNFNNNNNKVVKQPVSANTAQTRQNGSINTSQTPNSGSVGATAVKG